MTDVAFECANARVFTILVVDDEELVRMNACELLEAAGFIVCEAQCGSSGLAALDRRPEVSLLSLTSICRANSTGLNSRVACTF